MSRESCAQLRWFSDSPDAGDPRCLCSYCGERIEARPEDLEVWEEEVNADEGEPVRLWNTASNLEARFHARCFDDCLQLGLVELS